VGDEIEWKEFFDMKPAIVLVQASSRSWGGGINLCMNPINGVPALSHTLVRLREYFPASEIVIVAPEFDAGNLDAFVNLTRQPAVSVYYGHDASPLLRMVAATSKLPEDSWVIRVDGLNFCVDVPSLLKMQDYAVAADLDLMKFPDDWPTLFVGDLYRVGALRRLVSELALLPQDQSRPYHIHPKYFLLAHPEIFKCERYCPESYTTELLTECRERGKAVFEEREEACDQARSVPAADTLSFHYQMALKFLQKEHRVLDIACGYGFGSARLAGSVREVVGADLDEATICRVTERYAALTNLSFTAANALAMPFADASFDAVVSFETIEHLEAPLFLSEVRRVLMPGGLFIMSTPQNAIGHVPVNPHHVIEYSLAGIQAVVAPFFQILKSIGIKQGTIVFDDDPCGTNTILVCQKVEFKPN
jgi:2-polyprenyl-3-methyl-5-hydroxy-6-metoxy-1,4-benzoquinol methylase